MEIFVLAIEWRGGDTENQFSIRNEAEGARRRATAVTNRRT